LLPISPMAIQIADTFESSLRQTRILLAACLVSIPLMAYAGEVLGPATTTGVTTIGYLLVAVAILNIWSAFSWRRRRLQDASQILMSRPNDASAIKRWHATTVVLLSECESLAVWGVLMRVWGGGALQQAVPFYACAIILLLMFTPRLSPSTRESK
jgi:hypothetical protein